jgi:N-glycosylase/DNA lyase
MNFFNKIKELEKSEINKKIESKLLEFQSFKNKSEKYWFSELCFCILTANSKALTAIAVQKEIKEDGFLNLSEHEISLIIRKNSHRFHNNKAKYIVSAREFSNIKNIIQDIVKINNFKEQCKAREFIVKNIKGLSYKEASHFLRNVGYFNLAILDRHILNVMLDNKIIKEKPKTLNKNNYLEIEQKFLSLAKNLNMSPAKLDFFMWYMKAGDVLK